MLTCHPHHRLRRSSARHARRWRAAGGALLATAGTYLWYLGTNTKTNADRELVEGPGVRRRNIILVVALQVGAANFRSGSGRVCTEEERKQKNIDKLRRKGFDTDKLNF